GGDGEPALEGPAEAVGTAKAAGRGGLGHGDALAEQGARPVQPQGLDVAARRGSERGPEAAGKLAGTEAGAGRKGLDRQVRVEVRGRPQADLAERAGGPALQAQGAGKLGLSAAAAQEDDHGPAAAMAAAGPWSASISSSARS